MNPRPHSTTSRYGAHVRVLIVADTHGVLDARIEALAAECDISVHAGDVGSPEVLASLRAHTRVVAVRGNNDRVSVLPGNIPEQTVVELPGGTLAVVHGHQLARAGERHRRLRERFAGARAVVYGHSHRAVCDLGELPWVLNPGAAGRSRTFGGPSCLLLSAGADHWEVELRRFARAAAPRARRV